MSDQVETTAPTPTEGEAPAVDELQIQTAKAKENWDKYLRAVADLENFRKRVTREQQDARRYGAQPLLEKLIPVLDNFEMALAAASGAQDNAARAMQDGVAMIQTQLRGVLADAGLEEVSALGQPFDPNLHEAVSEQETAELPEGQVVQQLRKGYRLRDRLLRPATVVVAKKPVEKAE